MSIEIHSRQVDVTSDPGINLSDALSSPNLLEWAQKLDQRFSVSSIHIQSLDMFGRKPGFLKFRAEVTLDGDPVPGIVFMRGGSVAILTLLECEGKEYALLTVQARVPIGSSAYAEIPAGEKKRKKDSLLCLFLGGGLPEIQQALSFSACLP